MTTLIYPITLAAILLMSGAALYYRAARQRATLKLADARKSIFSGRRS